MKKQLNHWKFSPHCGLHEYRTVGFTGRVGCPISDQLIMSIRCPISHNSFKRRRCALHPETVLESNLSPVQVLLTSSTCQDHRLSEDLRTSRASPCCRLASPAAGASA